MKLLRIGLVCFLSAHWLGAAMALAEGTFIELMGRNNFWAGPRAPRDAFEQLQQVEKDGKEIKCFGFAPNGDWVFLVGANEFHTNNNELPACKKLAELQKQGAKINGVAFSPNGGWTVFWGGNGSWTEGSVPDAAFKKIVEVGGKGASYRSVAYGPHDAWVLLYDQTGVAFGNVPKDLAQRLNESVRSRASVLCVAFTGKDWICLTSDGWWTSNLDLPSTKQIALNSQNGKSPKWIAVQREIGVHDFGKWTQTIHTAWDHKLAGGYGFEVRQKGNIVANGAEGWARAPREKEHPSVKFTIDKPMAIASVSKTVTAVALLRLWEERNRDFSLDSPFWPYLKKVCPTAHAEVKRVTIRQLLTHHSGFNSKIDAYTTADLKKLLNAPLAHPPGEVEEYENSNFYICRVLLEQIGNVQYTPYVKEHVLKPMGITRMETHFQAFEPTCAYQKLEDQLPGFPFNWNQTDSAGAAGWYGSVSDLGRFLNGIRDHRVLTPETTEMMFKDKLGWDSSDPCMMKNGGWFWDEGKRAGELHSVITHFPDDIDAVILTNCNPPVSVEELVVKAWRESADD